MRGLDSATLTVNGAPAGLESVTLDLPQNAGESGQLSAFGIQEFSGGSVQLTALKNGVAVAAASFSFAAVRGPKSGSDGPMSRVRGVTMQDYTTLWDQPVGGREVVGLPPPPLRFQPVLYDIDKPLGSDLPTGEECEEKNRGGPATFTTAAQGALQVAGMDVRIIPGPGYVSRDLEDDYSTANKSVGQVLSELLFTNGVRWWLEGDLVVVDGRALPVGSFDVPASDRLDVAEVTFEDAFSEFERAPELADYVGRCAENARTDEGAAGTFETNADGVLPYYEQSGSLGFGGAEGDYASVRGTFTKSGGRLTEQFEEGRGYVTVPADILGGTRRLGPTYVKTLQKAYHPTVPVAEIRSVERVRTYADLAAIQSLEGSTGPPTEEQLQLYRQLQQRSPYLSSEKVVEQRWNAEGLLRVKTESSRTLAGMLTRDVGGFKRLELLYTDEERLEKWTPVGGGFYHYQLSGYTMVDRPVYETSDDPEAGAEPVGIMGVRTPFGKDEITDSPPPSVSIPLPTCQEMDTCLVEAEREYQRDLKDWQARQANNVPTRTYSVRFNCLKLNLKRGQLYGGGYVVSLTHSLARKQPGRTEAQVVVALD